MIFKKQSCPYPNIVFSCNSLEFVVEFHTCTSYPSTIQCYDISPYIGFKCSTCDSLWGIHIKNFKQTLDQMHFFNKEHFKTLNDRIKWAEKISQNISETMFCDMFQRRTLSYSNILKSVYSGETDMLRQYDKLPTQVQSNLVKTAYQLISNLIKKDFPDYNVFDNGPRLKKQNEL